MIVKKSHPLGFRRGRRVEDCLTYWRDGARVLRHDGDELLGLAGMLQVEVVLADDALGIARLLLFREPVDRQIAVGNRKQITRERFLKYLQAGFEAHSLNRHLAETVQDDGAGDAVA